MKLTNKIIITIVSGILCIGLCLSFLAHRIMVSALQSEFEEKGILIAQMIADTISHTMATESLLHISKSLQKKVCNTPLIEYAYISRFTKEIYAHSFKNGFPQDMIKEIQKPGLDLPHLTRYFTSQGPILDIAYPLTHTDVASIIHIGMNGNHTHNNVIKIRKKILSATIFIMVFSICVSIILGYYFTRPFNQLMNSVKNFGRGEPKDISLPDGGGRELQDFVHALNQIKIERTPTMKEFEERCTLETKAVHRTQSEFLSNMSHEIHTPLNGIVGMTNILLDADLTSEQLECAMIIKDSADLLLTVINDILDFSVIEAGKMDLEELDFDLRITLDDLNDILSIRAHDKGIKLICKVETEVPSLLKGDPGRLRQILINLMGNAIKFTDKGEVRIHVILDYENDIHSIIRFIVSDTGIGIPEERIKTLFGNFTQGDDSHFQQISGTGLSLSLCKHLVELMNGQIGVESKEGEGSTFWFTARLKKYFINEETGIEFFEKSEESLKETRIITIDDHPSNRLVFAQMLDYIGCRHEEVADAMTCLKRLREATIAGDPFSIALVDMQLPDMDGESLGKKIKGDQIIKDTILVMMTSIGTRGDAARSEEIGFTAYFTKPIKQSLLHDCIKTIIYQNYKDAPVRKRIITRYTLAENRKHKIRILLVEGNIINRKATLKVLENMGYRADAVPNTTEAINALETFPYDMVLIGLPLSEIEGLEASHYIRAIKPKAKNMNIPIIAISNNRIKNESDTYSKSDIDDYVSAPPNPAHLATIIEKWVLSA